jgi:hypothetical protein
MKRTLVALTAALALAACEKSKAPSPTPPAAAGKTGHAAQEEHAHAAPHGGVVADTATGHLELVGSRDGTFKLYVLDEELKTRPVTGGAATLKLTVPGYADVKLAPEGDALVGKGQPFQAEHPIAVVSVTVGGATLTGRFALHLEPEGHGDDHPHAPGTPPHSHGKTGELGTLSKKPCPKDGALKGACVDGQLLLFTREGETVARALVPAEGMPLAKLVPHVGRKVSLEGKPLEGEPARLEVSAAMPEHDHTPLHGGMVLMVGDLHLEVLGRAEGEVRVYLTDAFRRPVPLTGRKGQVELTTPAGAKAGPLAPVASGEYLAARFDAFAQPQVEATVRLPVEEDPDYFITLLLDTGAGAVKAGAGVIHASAGAAQEARLEVAGGYSPSRVVLKKGVPARLTVLRKDTSECSRELHIPEFNVRQELTALKETVVHFTPTKAGTYSFSCGMDMLRGTLVVEN